MSDNKEKVNKTSHVTLRLDSDTLLSIERLAKEYQISKSEVIRLSITGSLEKANSTHYIDNEQAKIINKNIIALGNVMVAVKDELRRIGVNFNQLVRIANNGNIYSLFKKDTLLTREELDELISRLEVAINKAGDELYVFANQ